MMAEDRRAIALWCGYCLLQALGLYLMFELGTVPGTIPLLVTVILLPAYACADIGIDVFIHGRARYLKLWLGLLAVAELFQLGHLVVEMSAPARAIGYNLGVAALLLGPMITLYRPLRREFGRWGLLPLGPGGLVCVLAVARCGVILADPSALTRAPAAMAHNLPQMTATLLAAGAFNISFIGLVIARLVLRLRSKLDTDALTTLSNRGGLEKHLASTWALCLRHHVDLSVAFIDIDRFKQINDAGGHEAGDRVIRLVAEALLHNARASDRVGRWGGDEFMVVMSHTDLDAATLAMDRLRERVRVLAADLPPNSPELTLSIGVATRRDSDARVQDLVLRADADMYRAKRARVDGPRTA
jgi:diguanylate cyclase (GGDEF)-like protein